MSNRLWYRIVDFLGFSDDTGYEPELDSDSGQQQNARVRSNGKIVTLHKRSVSTDLVVFYPVGFEDVQVIVDNLNDKKPVVVNLENTDQEVTRRLLDFLAGAIYAINGQSQKVGGYIFVFAPKGVNISALGNVIQ